MTDFHHSGLFLAFLPLALAEATLRDSVIGIVVIGLLGWGWLSLKKAGLEHLPKSVVQIPYKINPAQIPLPSSKSNLGGKHDPGKNKRRDFKNRHLRKDKAASGTHQAAEGVPSIYSESEKPVNVVKKNEAGGMVPSGYLASTLHRLPSEISSDDPKGLRLFIQCFEIQSENTRQTTLSQCNELARKASPNARQEF